MIIIFIFLLPIITFIQNTIITIGSYSFTGCSILSRSLIIRESSLLSGTGFDETIDLIDTLISIGKNTFNGCLGFIGALSIPRFIGKTEEGTFSVYSSFNGQQKI